MNIKSRLEAEEAEAERLIQYLSQGAANQELSPDDNTQEKTSALNETQNTENKKSALQEIEEEKQPEVVEQKENIVDEFAETSEEDPAKNDANFENQYKILQGKYNAEVPRLSTLLKLSDKKNERLTANNQELITALAEAEERASKAEAELLKLNASNDDTAGYEPELFNAVERKMARKYGLNESQAKAEVKKPDLQQQTVFSKDEAMQAVFEFAGGEEKFYQIDGNPEFQSWLKEVDRFTGETRHTTMVRAFNNEKFETAAEYYLEFDRALQNSRSLDAAANKRKLDSMQAPKSKGDSSPSAKENKDVVYDYELDAHSDAIISGKYKSQAELEKAQARIDRAIKNNAVIITRRTR